MKFAEYNVIGVMSGTSLDGIDLVFANFKFDKNWSFKIKICETVKYPTEWSSKLSQLVSFSKTQLIQIDMDYTKYLAGVINDFLINNNITNIDAVCSHGHTALHQPEKGMTYQIGNRKELAQLINQKVVCDFRVQDVELGGQGAPLVPIGDKYLFSEYDFCLNLGGFANISMDIDGERIAYDICPVNIVLNKYVNELGLEYDENGNIARSGSINEALLKELNQLPFYNQSHPKSLGLEWVKAEIFPLIGVHQLEIINILKTFCEHVAIQISNEINRKNNASVLITGGGAYNLYLMERIHFHSKNQLVMPSKNIIEFKEALIFAFLGVLKLRNEINCLKSVTGALKDHSSGVIFSP